MEKSLFKQYVEKWFPGIVGKIVTKLNGSKNPLTYMHKTMLTKKFSPTLKWASLTSNGAVVAADVVSLNSSLPLKKRDTMRKVDGDIPKVGMKLALDEQTLTDLDLLVDTNGVNGQNNTYQIIATLFKDAERCIQGIDEQLEAMFLQALSTGVTAIEEENNTGAAVRLDFGYEDKNKFGVEAKWSGNSAKPVSDLVRIMKAARRNGDRIIKFMMPLSTFDAFAKHQEVRDLFAMQFNFSGGNIPIPNIEQTNTALRAKYGFVIETVDRQVTYEKNGKLIVVDPWAENVVIGLTNDVVGTLYWGRLAENRHRAKQVDYQTVDEFKLISKYHKIDPLEEITSGQARVVPVIDNVDSIYVLNSEEAATDAQTEGDANLDYTLAGTETSVSYTKASVVEGLNATKEVPTSTVEQADSTLLGKINKLSDDAIKVFEAKLVEAV